MKHILVFGDIEMGAGTVTDDFISDTAFCRVIDSWARRKGAVDLVLNGDTFDFLKVNDGEYSSRITEKISLRRLGMIERAHASVFESLKRFAEKRGKRIVFIIGNHDQDLLFPKVQRRLRSRLGRVVFAEMYKLGGVRIEHGHHHDFLNRWERPFRMHAGERVLNVPFGSAGVLTSYVRLKEEHPFLERIHTHHALFQWYPKMVRKLQMKGFWHVSQVLRAKLFDSTHPITHLPRGIFKELYKRWQESDWNVPDISRYVRSAESARIYVLGHRHKFRVREGKTTVILPDTWRDEYVLDGRTGRLYPKAKRYVHIIVKGRKHFWKVVTVPVKRSVWSFKDVLKDEQKYLGLAAKEEKRAG
ncbi:hypothetical protein C4580_02785 [Candidatus Woesearchaeota archaeon]|nr:MAG: hypothetical protein C4580_02785 [Candidatus Woesearchaeota archaeon]